MNAKQAFEEAHRWMHGRSENAKAIAACRDGWVATAWAEVESLARQGSEHFTRRASEVEAEDAAWTAEVRRLANVVIGRSLAPRFDGGSLEALGRDARLLATLVLNAIGEKP